MLSSEERRGLWFTLIGGGALALALLIGLGFFRGEESGPPPAAAATPRAPVVRLGSVYGRLVDARRDFGLAARTVTVVGVAGRSDHYLAPASARHPGSFEVRALPEGDVTLELGADGYVATARTVEVRAGVACDLGVIALTPLAHLTGRVVDGAGDALGTARATVVLHDSGREIARAATDDHGAFRFERLVPSRYELDLAPSAEGDTALAALAIDATAGGEQPPLELVAVPSGTLVGTLLLPIGSAPARAIAVGARRGAIGGDGRFTVESLRAGPCLATVELDDGRTVEFAASLPCAAVEWQVEPPAETPAATPVETPAETLAATPAATPFDAIARQRAAAPSAATSPLAGDGALRVRLRCGESCSGAAWLRIAAADAPERTLAEAYTTRAGEALVRNLPIGVALRVEAWSGRWQGSGEALLAAGVPGELRLALEELPP
ncbi:MAG: carboxypeptidase regulatory-like domain-containing protein [Planctomycetes bacterium]|nr:carboxypeptidase regulatory-like domain-containing protein [Planctomycetota bacterium]